jgi:hypothetical protein
MATSLINTECKRYGCMKNLLACYANCKYNGRCEELRSEVMPIVTQAANDINSYRQERGLGAIEIQTTKRGLKFIDVLSLQKKTTQGKNRINQASRIIKAKPKANAKSVKVYSHAAILKEKTAMKSEPVKGEPLPKRSGAKANTRKSKVRVKKVSENKILPFTPSPKASAIKAIERLPERPKPKIRKKRKTPKRKKILTMEMQAKMPRRAKELATPMGNNDQDNTSVGGNANPSGITQSAGKTTSQGNRRGGKDLAAKKKKKMFIILDGNNSALVDERGLMAKLLAGVSPNARYFEATEIELRLQIAYKK